MRELNRRFRAKDKPTDVLSFPAADVPGCGIAGDIAISAQIASENARSLGHKAATELKILVLHGLLHLAGFNHETDNGKMARKERKLRRELKLPDGLIERTVGVRQHSATRTKLLTQDKQSSRQGRQSPGQGAGGGRNRS
jgi:probable rRNA maturation factor